MRKRLTEAAISNIESQVAMVTGERHSTVFGIVHPDGRLLRSIECIDGEWVETDKPVTIYTAEKLERAVKSKKRFVIVYGGRGSMKSVGVVDIMLAGVMDHGDKVYCLREFQESISDSVHALNKEEVKRLGLEGFTVQEKTIFHTSGGEFRYRGLARNPESIKSAAGFRRFFIEEAAKLSEASISNLTPTARNASRFGLPGDLQEAEEDELRSVQMFFVANPSSSADPFSKRFVVPYKAHIDRHGYYEDDLHLIIKMDYNDNPWFAASGLEQERLFDYENKSRAVYDHVWRGEFLDTVDNSIIESEWFDACIDAHIKLGFNAEGQDKLAFDPADTGDAKALAYSRGCVVLGVTETKLGLINEATDWAIGHANRIKPDVFIWDVGGSGGGLVRQVQEGLTGKRIKIVQFNGAMVPQDANGEYDPIEGEGFVDMDGRRSNTNMFINQRAQCYWRLRDRIFKTYLAVVKGKYFPKDELISFSSEIKIIPALRAEICRIPRKLGVPSGRIQILSKPEMKKLGISSPNLADAVMMLQRDVGIYSDDDYEESITPLNRDSWA